ncbi:MAG: nucleotidyltransferase domain-containing protein, partial [bacterium]|nr:nucleotidyltransferase domain-containing protein [bacterium]
MMNKEISFQIKKIAGRLKKDYNAEQVILFGSYARGEESEDSDIDLLITAPTRKRFFQRMAEVRCLIRDLRNGIPFAPIVLTHEELAKRLEIGDQFLARRSRNQTEQPNGCLGR